MKIKSKEKQQFAEKETKIHQGSTRVISAFSAHTTSFMKKAVV